MIPRATYRLQFHAGFTFEDARRIIPYLSALGISHVYASPITTARSGSSHGYDVADPTRINPELGGEDGFRALVADLRAREMGVILDIVPNHMGVGHENPWWMDVLKHGKSAIYASFFDVDWNKRRGRMLLPFLGSPLDELLAEGGIELVERLDEVMVCAHGAQYFPLRPDVPVCADQISEYSPRSAAGLKRLTDLLNAQHYELAWWRTAHDELNWRRFFAVSELAGLRIEEPTVFEAAHALYFRLYGEGLIDGLRVDHVDGLAAPGAYCQTLRQRLSDLEPLRPTTAPDGPAWLLVEKILGPGEALATDWGVDGTTGYEFMDQVSAVTHVADAEPVLAAHWAELSGRSAEFEPEEVLARRQMLHWEFGGQLEACVDAFFALAQSENTTRHLTRLMLRRAIEALLTAFPVYRTYGDGQHAPDADARVREIARDRAEEHAAPGEVFVLDHILSWLAGEGPRDAGDAARRFQQLSSPIAAKSVEDTAFYRYGRLLSRNDVGFDVSHFSFPISDFHALQAERAEQFPHAMLTTATHDHKRGEDVRARLSALSQAPEAWIAAEARWYEMAGSHAADLDRGDVYMAHQMVFGTWPTLAADTDREVYGRRLIDWQIKALREAKLRSSWPEPQQAYENRISGYLEWLTRAPDAEPLRSEIMDFVGRLANPAMMNSLAQVLLRNTLPGVPDLYQGAEFADLSMVDPDNRRPVDYDARSKTLASGADAKQTLIRNLLALRRRLPGVFGAGEYVPLNVAEDERALCFARMSDGRAVVVCVLLANSAGVDPSRAASRFAVPDKLAALTGEPAISLEWLAGRMDAIRLEADGVLFAAVAAFES